MYFFTQSAPRCTWQWGQRAEARHAGSGCSAARAARRPGRGGARRGPAGEVKEDVPAHGVHDDHGLRTRAARASAQRGRAPRRVLSRQCGGGDATLCPEPRTMASIVKESRVKYWSRRSSSCAREGRATLRRHPGAPPSRGARPRARGDAARLAPPPPPGPGRAGASRTPP